MRDDSNRARSGRGGLVLISGAHGIGKTRLAAELAVHARRARMAVAYAGGTSAPAAAAAMIELVAGTQRPSLLVLDDLDDAGPALLSDAAALATGAAGRALLVLALHRDADPPPALARLAGEAQKLRLGAIDPLAAERIAALYASGSGQAIPLQTLMAKSEGVPLAVHRAASEWARLEVAERLAATAGRAVVGRSGLRDAEAAVASNVVDLQAARERERRYALLDDAPLVAQPAAAICPYRGLAPFDAAHTDYFFGRERLVGGSSLAWLAPRC